MRSVWERGVAVEIVVGGPDSLSEEQAQQLRYDLSQTLDRPVTLSVSTIPRDTFCPAGDQRRLAGRWMP